MSKHRIAFILFLASIVAVIGGPWASAGPGVTYPPATLYAQPAAALIFQPGGTPNAAVGLYTTWATLYTAASAVTNPVVIVDSSKGAATVPAGSYTIDGWTLTSSSSGGFSTLTFADGAAPVIAAANLMIAGGLTVQTAATSAPTFTIANGAFPSVIMQGGSFLWNTSAATQPLFRIASGGFLNIYAGDGSVIEVPPGGGTGSIVDVASGGTAVVTLVENGTLGANCITGAGTAQITFPPIPGIVHTQNDAGNVLWESGPATTATFSAAASLTASTAAQNIPPSGTTTVLASADNLGTIVGGQGVIADLYVSFTGSASNSGGQTAAVQCYRNGSAITGLATSGTATTTGVKTAHVALANPIVYNGGDVMTCRLTTGSLIGALTDITVAIGSNP